MSKSTRRFITTCLVLLNLFLCQLIGQQIGGGGSGGGSVPSTFSIAGPITLTASGAGVIDVACGTTPSVPALGAMSLFCDSENSNHLTLESHDGTATDLQAGGGGGGGGGFSPNTSATGAPSASLPTSGWTAVNGVTFNDFSTSVTNIHIVNGANSSVSWKFIKRSLTVPYTLYVAFSAQMENSCNAQSSGIYLTDGTKVEGFESINLTGTNNGPAVRVETMTNVTTDGSTVAGPTYNVIGGLMAFRIVNNGSTRVFSYWGNGAWHQVLSEASGTFLTETDVGPGGLSLCSGGTPPAALAHVDTQLLYWSLQ